MVHFAFVLHFGYPFNREQKTRFDFYAFDYCYPYFYQDWRLFTPCPDNNFDLYVKFKLNGKEMYEAPLQEILKFKNEFNGKEFCSLAFTASSGYMAHETEDQKEGIAYFPIGKNYFVLQTATKNYLNNKYHTKITDLKMVLVFTNIKTNKKRTLIDK